MARTAEPPLGELTRHQVAGALRQLVTAVGEPVALLVDDAHLADTATIEVLVHLAGADAGAASLAVLAFREVPRHDALQLGVARLTRGRRAVRIDVGPLPRDALRSLVAAETPEGTVDSVVDEIVQRADGNPFFAQQLVEGLHEAGTPSLTATAREAVTQRMVNHLDEQSVGMLERLAVAGNDLDLDGVAAMTGLSGTEAGALLDRAIATGVLHVSGVRYRFRHDLIRQALVEGLSPHEREAVHRDAAQRLTESAGPPARIASHWLGGNRPQQAVPWLLEAGERALRVGAFVDARSHFERLLEEVADHPRALRGWARALDALGDPQAPVAHAAAARVADEETAGEIRAHQALAQLRAGDPSGALDTLAGVATHSLPGQVAEALTLCGAAMLGVGDVDTATRRAQRARQAAMDHGDPTAVTDASWAMSLAAHARHELAGLLETELLATRDMPGLAARVFDGYLCTTEALLYGGQGPERVIEFAEALAAESRRAGALRGEAFAVTVRGEARLLADDLDAAAADLEAGAELYREIGALGGRSLALQRQAEVVLAGEGDRDRAGRLLRSALAAARDSDLSHHLLDRIYGTRIAAARTPEETVAALDEGELAIRGPFESCPPCRITFAIPAAVGAARIGDLERAEPHLQMAELLTATIWADTGWVAALDEVRGHLARARGEDEAARTHFREALGGFEDVGQVRDARRCAELLAAPG
ncbi:MAG: ATP-binding protein [Actinomycetota bacterium]